MDYDEGNEEFCIHELESKTLLGGSDDVSLVGGASVVGEQLITSKTHNGQIQYAIAPPDEDSGIASFRVVELNDNVTNQITAPVLQPAPALLTTTINGQLYIINQTGGGNDLLGNPSGQIPIVRGRALIPKGRPNDPILKMTRKRDEKRRATHNEVERRRRDKINNWIVKLSKIIPEGGGSSKGGEGTSKGLILSKACEYIMELRQTNQRLTEGVTNLTKLELQMEAVKRENEKLKQENTQLKQRLDRSKGNRS